MKGRSREADEDEGRVLPSPVPQVLCVATKEGKDTACLVAIIRAHPHSGAALARAPGGRERCYDGRT